MPLSLRKANSNSDECSTDHSNIEPPEVPPARVLRHGTCDNRSDLIDIRNPVAEGLIQLTMREPK